MKRSIELGYFSLGALAIPTYLFSILSRLSLACHPLVLELSRARKEVNAAILLNQKSQPAH